MLPGIINKISASCQRSFCLGIVALEFRICFEFRASDFEFNGQDQTLKLNRIWFSAFGGSGLGY